MNLDLLEELGLTKSEIKVYLAMLELGETTTGPIVELSGASSSKIYEILEKLMQKGLASYVIKSGTKYFEAADPNRLVDYVEEKETELKEKKKSLSNLIPSLELKRTLSKYKSEATIYKGMKGLETAFQDILKTLKKGETDYVFTVGDSDDRITAFFKRHYLLRAKKGIKTKTIFSEAGRKHYELIKKIPCFEGKVLGQSPSPATVNVYGDKVILRMGLITDVLAVMINNKSLADSFKSQFNDLWNQDTIVEKGFDSFKKALLNHIDSASKEVPYTVMGAAFGPKKYEKRYVDFFRDIHKLRNEKGVPARLLFPLSTLDIVQKNRHELYDTKNAELKFLPYNVESPVEIITGKEKVILAIHEKEPTVITINNKNVAASFKTQFDNLWNQDVHVYRGFDDVMGRFESMLDELESGDEYYVLGATYGEQKNKLKKWFFDYHKKRVRKGVKVKLLSTPEIYPIIIKELTQTGDPKSVLGEVRKLPPHLHVPMQINLYEGNKVLMFLFDKDMMCFEIDSKLLYNNFKTYFKHLWSQDSYIVRGLDAIQNIFDDLLNSGHCDFIGARGYFIDSRKEYAKEWEKKAIKSKFTMRNIVDKDFKGHKITQFSFAQTKYTLQKEFSELSVFWIYGGKVVISNWTDKEPIAFVIENKLIHEMYKKQFELLWNG